MTVFTDIVEKREKIVVVGLGYVGIPLAVAFARKTNVIGFDLDRQKIEKYQAGIDPTEEVENNIIASTPMEFTYDEKRIGEGTFVVIAVPTPVYGNHVPDLSSVISASEIVGRNMRKESIIVYESTVYPGCTEDICVPILERESGLKAGVDFKVGYSPERINPGDNVHRLETIKKIVSGSDSEALEEIQKVYELIIEAGTHPVSNIKTAEAVKIAENSQRDINIAFMNELAMVFDQMGIDTNEVVDGMNTKWNALGFRPGLVGGHCIGVDPYYFTYQAEKLGYHSPLILNGRKINEGMGKYIADTALTKMREADMNPKESRIAVLGLTFKENCHDIRNSKVVDIIDGLKNQGVNPVVVDPFADKDDARKEYGILLKELSEVREMDCIIVAVAHKQFRQMPMTEIMNMYRKKDGIGKIMLDVKGIYSADELRTEGITVWRL